MNIVLNKIRINSPIETVFETVTTAQFWPEWHPSCSGVDGVVDAPYQLDDEIHQVAYVAGKTRRGTWLVTEHVPLQKVTLEMDGGRLQIRYTFIQSGGTTRVIRRLTYPMPSEPGGYTSEKLEKAMHEESELGLQQLKSLIERKMR